MEDKKHLGETPHEETPKSDVKDDLKKVASGVSGLAKAGAKEGSKLFKKGLVSSKKLVEKAKEAKLKHDLKKDEDSSKVVVDADIEEKKP